MSAIDTEHPWLGLDSFTEETRQFFHGREEEVAELARRVQRKQLTILFGQSGLGKTSILRAGIVPRLRPAGYCPIYVRIDYSPDSPPPSEQIKQAILRATVASGTWTQPGVAVQGESLWEFLHHRDDVLHDADGRAIVPLLIFDQFEEIFTIAQGDDASRARAAEFVSDLADLVENRPPRALEARLDQDDSLTERFDFSRADYRILIALREDYLAHLETFKTEMPSITQNRMRLARMTGEQALAAVLKPGGRLVTQEVAESIVRFIAGGAELRNAEVEPSLLSLICRELNNTRIAQQRREISADLLAGSHDTILNEFYERALADQPAAVRLFIEDAMLTESGYRESLAEERVLKAFAAAGANAADTLAILVNRRLLRIEERLDLRRVELTHDVLCPVVRASRDLRHEREARDEAERALAAQQARAAATRRALIRARQIAIGCAVLAVVAVAAGVFGVLGMQRAQQAEARAEHTRTLAETARSESERLIIYLLDDFYRELEPVGRLDIMGELARRALDYYAKLPPELNTTDTARNRALAQVRYGAVLRNQAKLDEATTALDAAIVTLEQLLEAGDKSESSAIGLSLGLAARARVAESSGGAMDSLPLSNRAVEVIRPVGEATGASVSARRTLGLALTQQGFFELRRGHYELSAGSLERAREVFRALADLDLSDTDAAANFGITTAWLLDTYSQLGRSADARTAGEETRRITQGILERQPTHMMALRANALISNSLGGIRYEELHPQAALPYMQESIDNWQTLLRVDPSNSIAWNNLGASRMGLADVYNAMGRPREAMRVLETASDTDATAETSTMVSGSLSALRGYLAGMLGELGQPERSRGVEEAAAAHFQRARSEFADGSVEDWYWPSEADISQIETLNNRGEYRQVLERGAEQWAHIDSRPPEDDSVMQLRDQLQRRLGLALAQAGEASEDYAASEAAARAALQAADRQPDKTTTARRLKARAQTFLAIALARQGRAEEARATLAPALVLHRELAARNQGDEAQRLELALTLYAQALADPAERAALLSEARALVTALPAGMRSMRSTQHWQQRVQGP